MLTIPSRIVHVPAVFSTVCEQVYTYLYILFCTVVLITHSILVGNTGNCQPDVAACWPTTHLLIVHVCIVLYVSVLTVLLPTPYQRMIVPYVICR